MNILIIGSGGREHALAWKILQSPRVKKLYLTTTNASPIFLQQEFKHVEIITAPIAETDPDTLINFAQEKKIDLVVIGPEKPLALGISDAFHKTGIPVFGPTQAAAQIETSKTFAKDFMVRHNIPTARYASFNDCAAALSYLNTIDYPIVIKAAGLAAGKGVFLPDSNTEAEDIVREVMLDHTLGDAGAEIIIEERLQGEEVSLLAFSDGVTVKAMPLARDHKRLGENNTGPNTGGMGAYAPVTLYSATQIKQWTETILQATINSLRNEGKPFVGILYAGLMLTNDGAKVLEFNARFGDPETQVLMPLLDSDLIDVLEACIEQRLNNFAIKWKNASAVCVVLAAEGYPEKPKTGEIISGLATNKDNNTCVFHAGTKSDHKNIVTAGGRVLGITGLGATLDQARTLAYQTLAKVSFPGNYCRADIAMTTNKTSDQYAAAGVDIAEGNRTVKLMTAAVRATYGSEVLAGIGAFGGMYDASALKNMQKPVLVASTDGIGTKVHLAAQVKRFHSLGYDIVNHSINDILVQGARPLFFLDYLASSKLEAENMAAVVTGMAEACRAVGCALLGGETAEMPGVYMPGTFDVAGTIVGIVERDHALPRTKDLRDGDILLGLASSGPHTNGYSLIRKVFENTDLNTVLPESNISLIDALLAPHRCYLPIVQKALEHSQSPVKALIHITGGGFLENIPRILPENLDAKIYCDRWPVPPLFQLIQQTGEIPHDQMHRVFNMGIGMILVVAPEQVELLKSLIGETLWTIGELAAGEKEVILQ